MDSLNLYHNFCRPAVRRNLRRTNETSAAEPKADVVSSRGALMYDVSKLNSVADRRTVMALAQKRQDVYAAAFCRMCRIARAENDDRDDPLVRDFHETLAADQQILTEKNGRTTSASRTRKKIQNNERLHVTCRVDARHDRNRWRQAAGEGGAVPSTRANILSFVTPSAFPKHRSLDASAPNRDGIAQPLPKEEALAVVTAGPVSG